MKEIVYRTELKHIITKIDETVIRSRLKPILKQDPHANKEGKYVVRSLYFDTAEDKAVRDKIDGVAIREKYRIRIYNHNHSMIRLEKKSKWNGSASKSGIIITKEQVLELMDGNPDFISLRDDSFLREFYINYKTQHLLPKVIVDYDREAYFSPLGNVRITIDSNLRSSLGSNDLFNSDLISVFSMDPGLCILEIKFDNYLPDFIRDLVQLNNCSATAASKYVACRNYH